jgi:hypothetical protein
MADRQASGQLRYGNVRRANGSAPCSRGSVHSVKGHERPMHHANLENEPVPSAYWFDGVKSFSHTESRDATPRCYVYHSSDSESDGPESIDGKGPSLSLST